MYKIFIERRAEKDLNTLDNSLRPRIVGRILLLKNNPRFNAKKLKESENAWRLRIGDWRVLYEINDRNKEIKIYRIKHRKEVYQL